MATEFATARFPEGEFPRIQTRAAARQRLRRFVPPGSKARMRLQGDPTFGQWRRESEIVPRVLGQMDRAGVGPKIIVQREKDRESLSIREVSITPDLGADPVIEEWHALVFEEFEVRSGGLWLCRRIDGSSQVSRHGFFKPGTGGWRGAAEDVFVLNGGMPALVEVWKFSVDRARRNVIGLDTLIVDLDIWTRSGGVSVYGGQRHYHVHGDHAAGIACSP